MRIFVIEAMVSGSPDKEERSKRNKKQPCDQAEFGRPGPLQANGQEQEKSRHAGNAEIFDPEGQKHAREIEARDLDRIAGRIKRASEREKAEFLGAWNPFPIRTS